ncbi:NAD-dependent epimerase/dehydratase family protein [Streptomyces roseus]|uniref:NAD-dependent epimerase/dehydratase family protein n=1 Tax=Streptomyces roseus TaxID=66430 RepID=UPI0036C8D5BE
MDIIGRGFLARQLAEVAHRHPHAVVLAAGVSQVGLTDPVAFAREARLVRETARTCRETGRTLVFLSTASAAMYGAPGCTGREDCPHPTTAYGHHKRALEEVVRTAGCAFLILRLSHLVGPGQAPHQLVPALVRQVESGSVRIFRGVRRDLVDVRDFVQVLDHLLALGVTGEMINLASGFAVPVADVVTHLAALLGCEPRREIVNLGGDHQVSVQKLRSLLRWGTSADYRATLDRYAPLYSSRATASGARPH